MKETLFSQSGEIRGAQVQGELSTSFSFTPKDAQQRQTKGIITFLVNVKSPSQEKNLAWAKSIFASFENKFYSFAGSNLKALEDALDFIKDDLRVKGVEADILVANLWGSVLYVGKMGKGGFLLVRDGKTKKIDVAKVASGVLIRPRTSRSEVLLCGSLPWCPISSPLVFFSSS